MITAARTEVRQTYLEARDLYAVLPHAPLVAALLALTVVLSIAGALIGHPLFHLKLVTAAMAGWLVWPIFDAE